MNPRSDRSDAGTWLWLIVLISLPARTADAGEIRGQVREAKGAPVAQAIVQLLDTNPPLGAQADKAGNFVIRNVPTAPCLVAVKHFGHSDVVRAVRFHRDGTARLEIVMESELGSFRVPMNGEGSRSPWLVESWPSETTLDTWVTNAPGVWAKLLASAKRSIDLAEFYVSDDPTGRSSLTDIIDILGERAFRGIEIRLLVDDKFYKTYPGLVDSLDALENVQSRRLAYGEIAGGVLHAKYFIVDGHIGYLGSQNFDWRALGHIQELGVVLDDLGSLNGMNLVFGADWKRGIPVDSTRTEETGFDYRADSAPTGWALDAPGDTCHWQFVASPEGDLPAEVPWDLPRLVGLMDAAHDSIEVQLLTYKPRNRNGEMWDELDGALRRAASRGVRVKLLLANWGKRKGTVEYLQELSTVPGFELRFMNIPEHSSGFIPFARTVHAKYLVVDGTSFWLGTSNWERDYFYNSRNVGIVGSGRQIGEPLTAFFAKGWNSTYAERIQAGVAYIPPRIAE